MTLAAFVDSTGIHAPTFEEILDELKTSYRAIYGSDVYLENDSQDGQLLAVFAQAISDCNSAAVAVYNSFSPSTAQGAGLSSVVRINGIRRNVATNSTVDVRIVGQVGTQINNGVVQDLAGNKWDLPALVTVPISGEVVVTATAQEEGNIAAPANTVTKIVTPTLGWQTVNNTLAATPGAPIESDAALRSRQAKSTALPSITPMDAIISSISNLEGVVEVRGVENNTSEVDDDGIPAHSIAMIVRGGDAVEIATLIADKKAPGTGTYGTTTETIINVSGIPNDINFFRPTVVPIEVRIEIRPSPGFVISTADAIATAVAGYISALPIGGGPGKAVEWSKLFSPANGLWNNELTGVNTETGLGNTYNVTNIELSRDSDPLAPEDVAITFFERPECVPADVEIVILT